MGIEWKCAHGEVKFGEGAFFWGGRQVESIGDSPGGAVDWRAALRSEAGNRWRENAVGMGEVGIFQQAGSLSGAEFLKLSEVCVV